jgi:hypothetical protein
MLFTGIAALLILFFSVLYFSQTPVDASRLKKFDLAGILKEINKKTQKLGTLNQGIVAGLLHLDEQSGKTATVSDRLKTVQKKSDDEEHTLQQIQDVTGQQIDLSQELNRLSKELSSQMNSISSTGQKQAGDSDRLSGITLETRKQLEEALYWNEQLEQKLKSAASKSEQADRSLP